MSDEKDSDKKVKISAVSNEDNTHLSNAELNKLYPNTYKGVAKVAGLDRPHMVIDVPTGHYGIDVMGDEETTLIQKPPEKPYTIDDHSKMIEAMGQPEQAAKLKKQAVDALTDHTLGPKRMSAQLRNWDKKMGYLVETAVHGAGDRRPVGHGRHLTSQLAS